MEAVAEDEISVLLSSHVVSDLERVCDHLVVLVDSQVRVAGDVEELLATHHRLSGPAPRTRHVAGRPARRLGQPHRSPVHLRRTHASRRSSIRPGRSPRWVWRTSCWPTWRARRPRHRPAPRWRCSDDLADLAAVPHPVHRRLRARRGGLCLARPHRPGAGSSRPPERRTCTTSSPATIGCSSTAASPSSRWRPRSSGSSGARRWWPGSSRPAPIGSPGTSRSPAAAGSR